VDETPKVELNYLPSVFRYPVSAYVKENGYLGILSGIFDEEKKDYVLFACSKSTNDGPYAKAFKDLLLQHLEKQKISESQFGQVGWLVIECTDISQELNKRNVSLVFEVINPQKDPHIIEYNEASLVLLDIIENRLTAFVKYK
jgi:tRNA splicing ligase